MSVPFNFGEEWYALQARPSTRSYCRHCKGERTHTCKLCPVENAWVEYCMTCGMAEFSDDELAKRGRVYERKKG